MYKNYYSLSDEKLNESTMKAPLYGHLKLKLKLKPQIVHWSF